MKSLQKQSEISDRIQSQIKPAYTQSLFAASCLKDLIARIGEATRSGDDDAVKLSELYDAFCLIAETSEEMKTIITCAQAYANVREKLTVRL